MSAKESQNNYAVLERLLWDYDLNAKDFYDLLLGKKARIGLWNQERALIRVLERLGWYDIVNILGLEYLKEHLTLQIIEKLRFPDLQRKYGIVRKVLHGEPVSFSGWDSETRQRARDAVLSNRWYSVESSLL